RRSRACGDRSHQTADQTERRFRPAFRQQCYCYHRQGFEPARDPHFRAGCARAEREKFHEDRLARTGGVMSRARFHVKKGDNVEVISGNFRGSSGKVLQVLPKKQRVLIEGVRIIKKHLRKSQDNPQGKIAEREGPVHISNVRLIEREKKAKKKTKTKPKEVAEKKAA